MSKSALEATAATSDIVSVPMLSALRLQNFRRFQDHEIEFERRTLLVGPNNAGKSTIVEALRLVSLVTNRFGGLHLKPPPEWLNDPAATRGVVPSLRGYDFDLGPGTFHRYGDPPAKLIATFGDRSSVTLFVGPDREIFGVVRDSGGRPVVAKRDVAGWKPPRIGVQPQVGPLAVEETFLTERTVREGLDSSLAPQHFRNQLRSLHHLFEPFVEAADSTWPGLHIARLRHEHLYEGQPLTLEVRVGDFVGEVATMGHGLQMWLQLVWFVTRASGDDILVLDEPDVFMHPTLQRRLIRYLGRRDQQIAVATHSVELMAEVEPSEIVSIDPDESVARGSRSLSDVRRVVEKIGGLDNVHVTGLLHPRQYIFVEGKDLALLERFQARSFPKALDPLRSYPNSATEGWGGWKGVVAAARSLRQLEPALRIAAIFDSDYHWPAEIEERRREALAEGIDLHIWHRKELENYLLVPEVVVKLIELRSGQGPQAVEVRAVMERLADSFRETVLDGYMDGLLAVDRRLAPSTVRRRANDFLASRWTSFDNKLALVPGKELISKLSDWSAREFGVSFGPGGLASALSVDLIDPEIASVIAAVDPVAARTVPASAAREAQRSERFDSGRR